MATKLKSTNKRYFKIVIYFLLCVVVSVGLLSLAEIKENYKYTKNENIYWFDGISAIMDEYTGDVVDYSLYYKEPSYASDKDNITIQDRIICQNEINEKINLEYENFSNIRQTSEEFLNLTEEEKEKILNEEKAKIEEKYELDEKELEEYILERKSRSENALKNKINDYENLNFVAYDVKNDLWINGTDLDAENIKNNSSFVKEFKITNDGYSEDIYDSNNIDVVQAYTDVTYYRQSYINIKDTITFPDSTYGEYNLDVYIGVNKNIVEGDQIYDAWKIATERSYNIRNRISIVTVCLILLIILMTIIYKHELQEKFTDNIVEKFKNYNIEYKLLILVFVGVVFSSIGESSYRYYIERITTRNVIITMILSIITYIIFKMFVVNYKEETLFNNNITTEAIRRIRYVMSKGTILKTLFLGSMLYVGMIFVIFIVSAYITYDAVLFFVALLLVTVIFGIALIKNIIYLDIIMISTKEGAEGKLTAIEELGRGKLSKFAHNINRLKDGLRQSLENEFKSEKMKTELITNVSHDLKTPLTSIINYVNLLKMENLESESAVDYINVLDKKSKRLQILIEDLFEVSKATSGAMELNIEKLEITQLINQAIGENQDKLIESRLNLKINIPEEKVFIKGDGKRLYRVLENLISNISKYSMKDTRVYITLKKYDEYITISIKNISSYELNFNTSDITDRFKRGDKARSTEGSGLGLAISKSIVELHNGSLNIDIDGDLFKVTIRLRTEF